ncbi:hypothetical protein D3C81_1747240 [compost metagenome]
MLVCGAKGLRCLFIPAQIIQGIADPVVPQRVLLPGLGNFCKLFKSFLIEIQIVISPCQPADRFIIPFFFGNGQHGVDDPLMFICLMPIG